MGTKSSKIVNIKNIQFLNKIGIDQDRFLKPNSKGGVLEIIEKFGIEFADTLAKKLNDLRNVDQGLLIDSFKWNYKVTGQSFEFDFSLNDYYKYLDQGRKPGGKFPWAGNDLNPVGQGNVLFQWVKRNGYSLPSRHKSTKSLRKGKFSIYDALTRNQLALAFIIGNRIKRNGSKGNKFFTSTVEDGRIEKLNKNLSKALGIDVTIDVKNFVKEITT